MQKEPSLYHTHIVRAHSEGPQHPSGRTSRFGSRGLLAAESLRCPLEQQQRLSRDRKAWVRPCSFCVPLVGGYLSWRSPVLPAAMSLTWEEGKKKKGEPPPRPGHEAQPQPPSPWTRRSCQALPNSQSVSQASHPGWVLWSPESQQKGQGGRQWFLRGPQAEQVQPARSTLSHGPG